jgi:hypothetical protein
VTNLIWPCKFQSAEPPANGYRAAPLTPDARAPDGNLYDIAFPEPTDAGSEVAMEKITIVQEGFELVL